MLRRKSIYISAFFLVLTFSTVAPFAQTAVKHAQPLKSASEPAAVMDFSKFPPNAGRMVALPKLTRSEINELIADLMLKYEVEQGYSPLRLDTVSLPPPSERITVGGALIKHAGKQSKIIRFGYLIQPRQAPRLWVYGVTLSPTQVELNPETDPEVFDDFLQKALEERTATLADIPLADLEAKIINLSYMDSDGALFSLKAMGISAITDDTPPPESAAEEAPAEGAAPAADAKDAPKPPRYPVKNIPSTVSFDKLPLVFKMPIPEDRSVGLVGEGSAGSRDQLGLTIIPGAASRLVSSTIASNTSQLLVLYHPDNPEKFIKVKKLIEDIIDKPARQVFIEGMVLEISQDGLKQLGVRYETRAGNEITALGSIAGIGSTFTYAYDKLSNIDPKNILINIAALVREGKAEILSRPSVLTLDNRQATIRVGQDIPIATSKDAGSATDARVSFSFQYIPTGILLNVRPRIDADGKEVSMLIDTTVSATIPGKDLQVFDTTGTRVLASAPSISTRRVQTYARIANNTPLIIGGLVSRDQTKTEDKVPFLGDIPFLGNLFKYQSGNTTKREVIIVLTPYILSEEVKIPKSLPKDEDAFDSTGTELFREAYRIRAEDVFDTRYIRTNRRLQTYRSLVQQVVRNNPSLATQRPLSQLIGDRVPGEQILVSGMLYNMLERLHNGDSVIPENFIFFENRNGEFAIQSVDRLLATFGDGKDYRSFFEKNPGKALALTFNLDRDRMQPGHLNSEPMPEVKLVAVPDRKAWREVLWEMNQPYADGRRRHTILIADESDVVRLKRAIAMKRTISVNGGEAQLTMGNFLTGKMLSMPEFKPKQQNLLEGNVAQLFFYSEHYYPAFTAELESTLQNIDTVLRRPDIAPNLGGAALPELSAGKKAAPVLTPDPELKKPSREQSE